VLYFPRNFGTSSQLLNFLIDKSEERFKEFFQFPVVKILDYRDQWDTLEQSHNPFRGNSSDLGRIQQTPISHSDTHKSDYSPDQPIFFPHMPLALLGNNRFESPEYSTM
jgi:hypothetical protein